MRGAVVLAALVVAPRLAAAQLCHDLPDLEAHHRTAPSKVHAHGATGATHDHGTGLALGLRTEAATAALSRRPIDYQGASLRVDWHLGRFHLRAQSSWYRLRDTLEVTYGPGDVLLAAMWTAVERPRWRLGVAAPVGVPLGDQEEHLGMGHWMIMPGAFFAAQPRSSVSISTGVAYHLALGNGGHNHGIGPYVNPMTASEVSLAGRVGVRVAPALQLLAESALAVPLDDGELRAILGGGVTWQLGVVSLTVVAQAGALHAPFTARGVADVAYAF